MSFTAGRPIFVKGMAYAPTCEQGVVFLFGRLAPQLGFHAEHVQVRFPDCIARRRGKTCRIEFELWASHFALHRHKPKGVDIIVCWENDWESRPKQFRHIEIIALKKYVGALPRIFVVGCKNLDDAKVLDKRKTTEWSVPMSAQINDLMVMYRAGKNAAQIKDIWRVIGPFHNFGKRNKEGRFPGLQAGLRLIARLKKPVTYSELAKDGSTRELGVVKKRFIGKTDITDDWPAIYQKLSNENPGIRRPLRDYLPD